MREAANDNVEVLGDGNCEWHLSGCGQRLTETQEFNATTKLRWLREAVALSQSMARSGEATKRSAVYVIGDAYGDAVKIGEAKSPISRLASLQTGSPNRLYIHRLFWVLDKSMAQDVEREAHRYAEEDCDRLCGEWFNCTPYRAHNIILEAMRSVRAGEAVALTPGLFGMEDCA